LDNKTYSVEHLDMTDITINCCLRLISNLLMSMLILSCSIDHDFYVGSRRIRDFVYGKNELLQDIEARVWFWIFLFQAISAQFTFEMRVAAQNRENFTKTPYAGR